MRLEGKVAIVTGSGRGLGKAYCLKLAQEGAKVVVVDVIDTAGTVKEIEDQGGTAIGLRVDVTSEEDTKRMAEEAIAKFGRIDILVNNAALIYGIVKPFYEIDPAEWDKIMAVNVKGQWLCTRAVFPQMKRQGKGKIINISSAAFWTASGPYAHYIASKGAVIGLTRALAKELGGYGINVNAIGPGHTLTEAFKSLRDEEAIASKAQAKSLKRVGLPEDIVGVVVFLASEESDYITGQTLLVEGGGSFP